MFFKSFASNFFKIYKITSSHFSLKIQKVTFHIWPILGIFYFYLMVKISAFSSSFRELVILVSRCFLKWPKSPKIRQNIPYPSTRERERVYIHSIFLASLLPSSLFTTLEHVASHQSVGNLKGAYNCISMYSC